MSDDLKRVEVKIKRLHPEAKIPVYGTEESAGFDIYSIENVSILPGEVKIIPTGLAFELPSGFHMQVWDRSGKAKEGVHHFAGILDSDYRGELRILLFNSGKKPHQIEKGERITQALILQAPQANFTEVKELSQTRRGQGGFHSTGKK